MKYKENYTYTRVLKSDQETRLLSWCIGGNILLLACEGNVWFSDLGCNKESAVFFWSNYNFAYIVNVGELYVGVLFGHR